MLFHKTGCMPGISSVIKKLQVNTRIVQQQQQTSNMAFVQTDFSLILEGEPVLPRPKYLHIEFSGH